MADGTTRDNTEQEVDMQLTPMIDVTFLLLIFFLCSIKFKILDGKLGAYLPRDRGVNVTDLFDAPLEKIEIRLSRSLTAALGFQAEVNGDAMGGMNGLYRKLQGLFHQDPTLEVVLHPGKGIEYDHVVKVLNECIRSGLTKVSFSGIPLDD